MTRNKIIIIFSGIISVTLILIVIGLIFNKTEAEKFNGLTETYDVSTKGIIAYVYYNEGKPEIYLKTETNEKLALRLGEDKMITDIDFSPNGTSLVYIVSDKEKEKSIKSSVHLLDVRSLDTKEVLQDEALITEIEFDPKNNDVFFYLKADVYENYSPVAQAYPHDLDIYSFHIADETVTRHTEMKKYSMTSLQVSPTEDLVYIQMDDDVNAETAEDIFETNQRIFEVPLDHPGEMKAISDHQKDVDVFDFTIIPEAGMIYQSISNSEATGGLYEYELYYYDWNSKEETKLTDFREYTSSPIITDDNTVYFILDKQFAQKYSDYHLYKMDLNGENITEIMLSQDSDAARVK